MQVSDVDTRHFADQSGHHQRHSFLCCCHFSLEQLTGSRPFFGISGAVQKATEDGVVHVTLY